MKNRDVVDVNSEIGISSCCGKPTITFPAIMGEPCIIFCTKCNTECERTWMPQYENVSNGTYRKIIY